MFVQITEGLRIFRSSLRLKSKGYARHSGTPAEICRKITGECWNSEQGYFMTSCCNFSQFWTRDFGMCCDALVKLGYKDKVISTLEYALSRFQKAGRITTAITPSGKPFDFPGYASDSVPFLIRSLKTAKADRLIKKHRDFIQKEINRYFDTIFDSDTGMVRADRSFSSIKDYSRRRSSAYDNSMAAMLKNDLDSLKRIGLENPFNSFDIKGNMKRKLWNGSFFYDDLNRIENVYGDANVFPFWTGVFTEKSMFDSCLKRMKEARLDRPFPLKYSSGKVSQQRMVWQEIFAGDYEQDTIWIHLGLCYLDALRSFGKNKELKDCINDYGNIVKKHGNLLEVFNPNGTPFSTLLYQADSGMLWASKLANLTTGR